MLFPVLLIVMQARDQNKQNLTFQRMTNYENHSKEELFDTILGGVYKYFNVIEYNCYIHLLNIHMASVDNIFY